MSKISSCSLLLCPLTCFPKFCLELFRFRVCNQPYRSGESPSFEEGVLQRDDFRAMTGRANAREICLLDAERKEIDQLIEENWQIKNRENLRKKEVERQRLFNEEVARRLQALAIDRNEKERQCQYSDD